MGLPLRDSTVVSANLLEIGESRLAYGEEVQTSKVKAKRVVRDRPYQAPVRSKAEIDGSIWPQLISRPRIIHS
jgi:flagella basal body P-ring formation protein FlgA